MPNEQELSSEKSLEIIQQMIQKAKINFTDNGHGWLLWGTMIFLASLSTFFLMEFNYSNVFLAWNIFGGIAIVLLAYGFIKPRPSGVRSYVSEILWYVDIGFAVCLFIIIFSINVSVGPNNGFGYLLMIYAFIMLIQAGALKFKPLMFGAVINWVGAMAIFINSQVKYDMLITAAAVFMGYIIPGLILRAQYKKEIAGSPKMEEAKKNV
jgi:hypothetical protein